MPELYGDRYETPLNAATKNVSLFLGAGFSKWACDLPLVSGLFDLAIHIDNATEEARLKRISALFDRWVADHPGAHVEMFIADMQMSKAKRRLINWYIVRRLTDDFVYVGGIRRTFYINSYRAADHNGVQKARYLFEQLLEAGLLSIVTTNYDMLPEYALGSKGMNYGLMGEQIGWTPYPYIKPVLALGDIRVAKLHGSVSWHEGVQKTTDSRFGLTGTGLIVPPISEKVPNPTVGESAGIRSGYSVRRRCACRFWILV